MATSQIDGNQIAGGVILDAHVNNSAEINVSKLNKTVITADGSNAFAANQPMGGFKLTGLEAGSAAGDSVEYSQFAAAGTPSGKETPSGTVNGSNVTFNLAHTPKTGSLMLFRNGQLQNDGGNDYTLSTATITFATAPLSGDLLTAYYRY